MAPLILAVMLLLATTSGLESAVHHHHGLYSGPLPGAGAQIVFPRKVGDDGSLTADLEHHVDRGRTSPRRRVRRLALDADKAWLPDALHDTPNVQYDLSLDGQNESSRLLLWPSTSFVAPALQVQRPGSRYGSSSDSGRQHRHRRRRRSSPATCHYQGVVRGDTKSVVALSACGDGLMGFIKTQKGEFWLEPASPKIHKDRNAHVIFRRKGRGSRSRQRGRRRRRHGKDCGTREPRRRNGTRSQWRQRKRGPGSGPSRRSRSVSQEKHVELLIVADQSMSAFHQDGDVETYLLTIINMVSAMYHDPSIGNLINIVVVRVIILEDWPQDDLFNTTVNADKTLSHFCRWAGRINPKDEDDPQHHDAAVLITRTDICARRDSPCNTLGVANVGAMCDPRRACSVNEDNGVVLAHTIAHELGHNFGMIHDSDSNAGNCPRKSDGVVFVMTPTFEADNPRLAWSHCSRDAITAFLDEGKGSCLDDAPSSTAYEYPDLPPGSMYDADHQCRLQFGSHDATVCDSYSDEICSQLWCEVDGQCVTLLQPAAPGTSCGQRQWCQDKECVDISEQTLPVPGGWSDWGDWGPCSRSCGAGVSVKERRCAHPVPQNGGAFCLGERRRYKVCNTDACPEGVPSYRAVQCAAFDNKTYHGLNYKWLPYFDAAEPCELFCSDSEDTMIVPWGGAAADGTPCNLGRRDMCVGHVCRAVGCDWTLDSDAVEDRCGVCRGNGSQCDTVSGVYTQSKGYGYEEMVNIPTGARNVFIQELEPSDNYIGISSETRSLFYLNGRRKITLPGEYDVGGTAGIYKRHGDLEKVRIPGPLKDPIIVYVIFRGRSKNPGVRWEYTVRRPGSSGSSAANSRPSTRTSWQWSDWTVCSATCGGGLQEQIAVCVQGVDKEALLPVEACERDLGVRPPSRTKTCAQHACPATWWTGPWQLCSTSCGNHVTRRRSVLCIFRGRQDVALRDEDCDQATRPTEYEPCEDVPPCPITSRPPESPGGLFSVTFSQPSTAKRDKENILDLEGLDVEHLDQDERDFLNTNYTIFLQNMEDDISTEDHVYPPPNKIFPHRDFLDKNVGVHLTNGDGTYDDDMQAPAPARVINRKRRPQTKRSRRNRSQGPKRKRKNGKGRRKWHQSSQETEESGMKENVD